MKKKLEDYLHLYLGCEVYDSNPKEEKFRRYRLTGKELGYYEHHLHTIKPILRPLSDMTEEELQECGNMVYDFSDDTSGLGLNEHKWEDFTLLLCVEQFNWLLSKHFDLFGLIDAGLAIDKTKM